MSGRGVGAAVIHRRADGDAGRHLVVEQPPDFGAQDRRDLIVERVVVTAGVGVETTGEVAFQRFGDFAHLRDVFRKDDERHDAERLDLQRVRVHEEVVAGDAQERVRVAIARPLDFVPTGDELRAGGLELFHRIGNRPHAALAQQHAGRVLEVLIHLVEERLTFVILQQDDEARFGAELPHTH